MMRNKRRLIWVVVSLVITSALWALNVEVTYEHNARRGIPANFQSRHQPTVYNWRT
jgi:hypothetical protein